MFKQAPELQKTNEEKMGSRVSNVGPIIFSTSLTSNASSSIVSGSQIDQDASKRFSQIDIADATAFLKLVAEGEQNAAEIMLQRAPDLALMSGDITDLSDRTFKDITGFQYAVWALDWHMWTMSENTYPMIMHENKFKTWKPVLG